MANLKQGMSGSEVEKLQKNLINAGYDVGSTGADGVFGKNTLAAVKQYQKDNGLQVDGIAGKNTLGSLYGTGSNNAAKPAAVTPKTNAGGGAKNADKPAAAAPAATTDTPTTPVATTTGESDAVTQANAMLTQFMASKPGSYQSAWQDEADAYLNQYLDRGPFSYDFNSDALYQQYKDQYIQQGQMAMMDTMGQAAAMTGGYGNSYAQTVGQQAYNQYLGQLNEVMPELYGMAYDRYQQEGQDLLNMSGIYMDRDAMDYGRYQDGLNNWYNELDYYYGVSRDAVADSQWQQTYDYGVERDKVADSQWQQTYNSNEAWRQKEFDYGVEQDNIRNDQWQQEFDENKNQNDKKWDYQAEQDAKTEKNNNYGKLYDLISSTGYTPSAAELAAAGMSDAEAKALKDAYSSSVSDSGSQYKDIDVGGEVYNTIITEVKRVEDINQLKSLVERYLSLGYNPDQVNALTMDKYDELMPKSPSSVNGGLGVGGGLAGGRYVMEAW